MAAKDLFVVTHTESLHHVERRVGGWYDTSLTDRGRLQAQAVGARLVELLDGRPAQITSSDLKRAAETAQIVASHVGVAFERTEDLREVSQGIAGGKPREWLDGRMLPTPDDNRLDFRNVEGAETRREAGSRIYRAVEKIAASRSPVHVIVTHGFALTFVIAGWLRIPVDALGYLHFRAASGSITHLSGDDFFGGRSVELLNDTGHIQGI